MDLTINEEFAKQFDRYRQKEEYQKLKSRYGDVKLLKAKKKAGDDENCDDSSSSSSSSDDSDSEWEDQEHEDFLRLYDALCRDDSSLNDEGNVWFREKPATKANKTNEQILLKDQERESVLSVGNQTNGETNLGACEKEDPLTATAIKANFAAETEKFFEKVNENENLFSRKASDSQGKRPIDTRHFTFQVQNEDAEFLRDYLVNRRWKVPVKKLNLELPELSVDGGANAFFVAKSEQVANHETLLMAPEELEADDEFLTKARKFEGAWNSNDQELKKEYPQTSACRYRFEEDDKEFIKTYPRKIDSTLRLASTKGMTRSEKRKARAERKAAEKSAKMADIRRLKKLKMAEIAEKLDRVRRTCGDGINVDVSFGTVAEDNEDESMNDTAKEIIDCFDNDWNPEEHDRLVAKLFGDSYYGAETADDGLDEAPKGESDEEDDRFQLSLDDGNYDDYLPRQCGPGDYNNESTAKESTGKQENSKAELSALARAAKDAAGTLAPRKHGKKKKQDRSLIRRALDRQKPIFDAKFYPDFEKYFKEFYQLDCEDIINGSGPGDDVHCRFKYREVKPNDFGLSVEEILEADEKELNRWVSVKAMSAYRTEEEEEREFRKYHSSRTLQKKASLLPSLFNEQFNPENEISNQPSEKVVNSTEAKQKGVSKKSLKRLRKKQRKAEVASALAEIDVRRQEAADRSDDVDLKPIDDEASEPHPTRKRKYVPAECVTADAEQKKAHYKHASKRPKLSDDRLRAAGIDPKHYKYINLNRNA